MGNKDQIFAHRKDSLDFIPKGSNNCSPSQQMVEGSTCSPGNSNFMSQSTVLNVSHFLQMPTELMWGPFPRGGRPENNGGQFINESVTNPLPNLQPMSAAQRRQWHSSWPLVVCFLRDTFHQRNGYKPATTGKQWPFYNRDRQPWGE